MNIVSQKSIAYLTGKNISKYAKLRRDKGQNKTVAAVLYVKHSPRERIRHESIIHLLSDNSRKCELHERAIRSQSYRSMAAYSLE